MPYTDEVAEEHEPDWVKEGTEEDDVVVEGMDVSGAEQMEMSDVIEPAKGVVMVIKKVVLDTYTPKGERSWRLRSLKPTLVIEKPGIQYKQGEKPKYANKHFFPRILVAVNRDDYDFAKEWYNLRTGGAWGDYNAFLKALGFPTSPAPRNDKAFRDSLVGRRIIVDIDKRKKQAYDATKDKYVNTDEYENVLYYRGAPKAKALAAEEAAVE